MRVRRKIEFITLLMIISLVPIVKASAAEQRYSSTIEIQTASTLTGSTRNYSYKNHKISIYPTMLDFNRYDTSGKPVVLVDVTLQKKGLLSYSNSANGIVSMYNTNTTYTLYLGNHGSGKYRYYFYTGTLSNAYGAFNADPVYMYSYE